MKYVIKYSYDTGDSFGRDEGLEGTLELSWNLKEVAKENLQRIKEHYEWYTRKYAWNNEKREDASNKDWFVKEYDFCLILKTDEGKNWQINAPWCGYFENLNNAWIEEDEEEGMKISFR